jgi:hypothetical protein
VVDNEYTLTRGQLPDGVHTLQVEATDSLGQVVDWVPATVKVDRTAPRVRASQSRQRDRRGALV